MDRFQGQEAPISIYSMATSSPEDAPRGMEFLYSLNRLNVATSRARCVAAIVMSPALVRVACRTPRQMRLANALCLAVESAAAPSGARRAGASDDDRLVPSPTSTASRTARTDRGSRTRRRASAPPSAA